MPDLDELYQAATARVEAQPGALERQHERQGRRRRGQRASVFLVAAAVVLIFVAGFWALSGDGDDRTPADGASVIAPVAHPGADSLFAIDVGTGAAGDRLVAHVAAVQPDIAPDGERMAFVRVVAGHEQIFVSTIAGEHVTQVTGLEGQGPCSCGATDPDWAPDGRAIVFSGTDLRGHRDLYTLDVASGEIERLTSSMAEESGPDWSHDGGRIVFARGFFAKDSTTLWVYDLATGASHRLSDVTVGAQPVWSPDDGQIAFACSDDAGKSTDLCFMRADGSDVRNVTGVWGAASPTWSPDGQQVAFSAFGYEDGQVISQITLLRVADLTATRLTASDETFTDPAWDPSGTAIIARKI